jgi:hypothetical protein
MQTEKGRKLQGIDVRHTRNARRQQQTVGRRGQPKGGTYVTWVYKHKVLISLKEICSTPTSRLLYSPPSRCPFPNDIILRQSAAVLPFTLHACTHNSHKQVPTPAHSPAQDSASPMTNAAVLKGARK